MQTKTYIIYFSILCCFFGLFSTTAWGHGLEWQESSTPAAALSFRYADGSPMAYAAIKVYAPNSAKIEFQQGNADKNGCFAFVPDQPGEWRIVADDGIGHQANAIYSQAEKRAGDTEQPATGNLMAPSLLQSLPFWLRLAIGFSLLLNIFAVIYLVKSRQSSGAQHAHS